MKILHKLSISLCLLSLTMPTGAQQSQSSEQRQPNGEAKVSIIAIGPTPPRRYRKANEDDVRAFEKEVKEQQERLKNEGAEGVQLGDANAGGIPILVPPLPGEVPPSYLNFKSGERMGPDGKKEDILKSVSVGFNNPVASIKVPAGIPLDLKKTVKKDSGETFQRYLNPAVFEPGGQYTLFLSPTGKATKAWLAQPKTYVMRTDGDYFQANQCRVLNFSRKPIMFMLGKEKKIVKPQSSHDFDLSVQNRLTVCKALDQGGQEMLMNTALRTRDGTRALYVFHDANPKTNAGKAVGVFSMNFIETPTLQAPVPAAEAN